MKVIDNKRGFSLLELLIVLAVVGTLLGLSVPLLSQFLAQKRLDEASITLSNALRLASDQAATQSESVTMTLNGTQLSWKNEADQALGQAKLPSSATLTPNATVIFSGRGLPIQKHDFTVNLGSKQKDVYLLPTGAVIIR